MSIAPVSSEEPSQQLCREIQMQGIFLNLGLTFYLEWQG